MSAVVAGVARVDVPERGDAVPVTSSTTGLVDQHGRTAVDLRVSLTDHCNLRCSYCMPAEGLPWLRKESLLTDAEIARLVRVAVTLLGVREVRFTGGEPLLRPGLVDLVAATAALRPRPHIALTTNGIGLDRVAAQLGVAGLDRVNVSLDTHDRETFTRLARRDRLDDVLRGLAASKDAGMDPVKVNAVMLRGVNDAEAADLLEFCIEHAYRLRFIEQMPLAAHGGWQRSDMVSGTEILARLRERFLLTPDPALRGSAPAQTWLVDGGPATVGVIASVTAPFCSTCDRTRLTADGQLRSCLFSRTEIDLRALLRDGATDEELADAWRLGMWGKAAGHGINRPDFLQPSRPMSAIGG